MKTAQRSALLITLLFLALFAAALVNAQETGQFCVRAYEDLNANGLQDLGENLLSSGVGVMLRDAEGVIVESALMETSPTGDRGLICFQSLSAGQYTVIVTSAEYTATRLDNLTAQVNPSSLPVVFEYGGRPLTGPDAASALTSAEDEDTRQLVRLVIAGAGALFTMMVVAFIGFMIYLLVLRQPGQPRHAYASQPGQPPLQDQLYMRPDSYTGAPPPDESYDDFPVE